MRIVCWQTILMNCHTLFFSKNRKDVAKFVVCCSVDWYFKVKSQILIDSDCVRNSIVSSLFVLFNSLHTGKFCMLFCCLLIFFQNQLFQKFVWDINIPSECQTQTVSIQIRPNNLLSPICSKLFAKVISRQHY